MSSDRQANMIEDLMITVGGELQCLNKTLIEIRDALRTDPKDALRDEADKLYKLGWNDAHEGTKKAAKANDSILKKNEALEIENNRLLHEKLKADSRVQVVLRQSADYRKRIAELEGNKMTNADAQRRERGID